jgi:hypothetical protein
MTQKNYIIKPPPQDKGKEPLFRVLYSIDIAAPNKIKAAEKVWNIMQDKSSCPPVLVVIDSKGRHTELDLSDILESNATLPGKDEIINRLNEILESIDVGGEQSRQFSNEIESLNTLLKDLNR